MSRITNVILSFHILEDDEERMKEVHECETLNQYYEGGGERVQRFVDAAEEPPQRVGGHKWLEHPVWLAAFNHIDNAALVDHILRAPNWRYPGYVQVLVCGQDDSRWTLHEHAYQKDLREWD